MNARARRRLEEYRQYLASERRLSPHTLSNYQRDLGLLAGFCAARAIDDWQALDPAAARGFVAQLHRQGLAGRSIQRSLSAARSYYRYLLREQAVTRNPFTGIPAPKSGRRLPKALSVEQAVRLAGIEGGDAL